MSCHVIFCLQLARGVSDPLGTIMTEREKQCETVVRWGPATGYEQGATCPTKGNIAYGYLTQTWGFLQRLVNCDETLWLVFSQSLCP